MGTIDFATASCSVMASSGLANGTDPGSTARLPPRLVAKDAWPQGPDVTREQPQDQSWTPSRNRGADVWAPGRERSQEQVWNSRDRPGLSVQDQAWMAGRERAHAGPDQTWVTGGDGAEPEQNWVSGRERSQDQGWSAGRDPGRERAAEPEWSSGRNQEQGWSNTSRDRGPVWRPGPCHL